MRRLPVMSVLAHSVQSTMSNLSFAFYISWPWMLAMLPFYVAAHTYLFLNQHLDPAQPPPAELLTVQFGLALLMMVPFASIAVNWHRYVLLDEVPRGLQRLRLDGTVLRYIGNTILIGLMLAIPAAIVAAALGLLTSGLAGAPGEDPLTIFGVLAMLIGMIALFICLIVFSYRLGVKLPAVALGRRDYGFPAALSDTIGNFWLFAGLGGMVILMLVMVSAVFGALSYPLFALAVPSGSPQDANMAPLFALFVANLALSWIATIWTVTLLTSLYGYFGEKRNF